MSNMERYIKPDWGLPNDRRGVAHHELAMEFVKDYPVGSVLSAEKLDLWLQDHAILNITPTDSPKTSDAWLGHLQRRHIARSKLNKAGTHPRLIEQGSTPFSIDAIGGVFEIRAPHIAVSKFSLPKKVQTLIGTKRQQLAYLMQSADWERLPPYERVFAEAIFDDITKYAKDIRTDAEDLDNKFVKLQRRLDLLMKAGSIVAADGGIKQLIAAPLEDTEE